MGLSVKERGAAVATFRFIQVSLMETLAAWVPTTPEMEVKLMFGAHIWDTAQHADALGKRTLELRLPLQHSLRPADAYRMLLDELAGVTSTADRISGLYDVLLPGLEERFHRYLEATDRLMDAPTVRIVERTLEEERRMIRESVELRRALPGLGNGDRAWREAFAARERAVDSLIREPTSAVTA